jgi:hypothetical protein
MFKMKIISNKKFKIPKSKQAEIIKEHGEKGLEDIYKAAEQDKERLLEVGAKEFIKQEIAFLKMYSKLVPALKKRLKERKQKV